jgi:hypothetical protein
MSCSSKFMFKQLWLKFFSQFLELLSIRTDVSLKLVETQWLGILSAYQLVLGSTPGKGWVIFLV